MTKMTFEVADVKRLATTLDGVHLDDTDRATLHAIFALAGRAAADESVEDEVSGFAFSGFPGASVGLLGSFQLGGASGGSVATLLIDTRSKLLQTASGMEKSMADTNMAIVGNIKQ